MNNKILQLNIIHDYYIDKSNKIFDEWLKAFDKEYGEYELNLIWTRYQKIEGILEGIGISLNILTKKTEELNLKEKQNA
jgi:hypothetical protein